MDLKRLLHESKDKHNRSLFDHVSNILQYIDNNPNEVSVEDFENISHFLASTSFAYQQYDSSEAVNNPKHVDRHGLKKHYSKLVSLFTQTHKGPEAWVQDFSEINCDWNIAGYGFGEEEAKTIHLILEKLASKNRCDSISFLGIVKGSKKDYFVAYGRLKNHVNDKLPESWEPNGTGVNSITFWVTNESTHLFTSVLGEWVELPAIGPDHVINARFIKHVVTGNLDAPVVTYPEFKGKEKHYLKTQLVRMMFNCELMPAGMYKLKEDAKEDEKRNYFI